MPNVLSHDSPRVCEAVQEALETGKTLIFPTDTIYGIGGNPWDTRSLDRIRAIKERPSDQPFTLHLPGLSQIERYANLDPRLRSIAEALLPGPYTLLLPAAQSAPPSSVQDSTIGVRVPDHPFFRQTLASLDRPIFGTSVNRHGQPPLCEINAIIDRFAMIDLIVTGPVGAGPSAILDLTEAEPRLVRGELPRHVRALLGEE